MRAKKTNKTHGLYKLWMLFKNGSTGHFYSTWSQHPFGQLRRMLNKLEEKKWEYKEAHLYDNISKRLIRAYLEGKMIKIKLP